MRPRLLLPFPDGPKTNRLLPEETANRPPDITVVCAGYRGAFAIDDAYCAGRIVSLLEGERTDAAVASAAIARAYPTAWEGVNARTYGPPGLEEDIAWCSQVSVLDAVPRLSRMLGSVAEVTL